MELVVVVLMLVKKLITVIMWKQEIICSVTDERVLEMLLFQLELFNVTSKSVGEGGESLGRVSWVANEHAILWWCNTRGGTFVLTYCLVLIVKYDIPFV